MKSMAGPALLLAAMTFCTALLHPSDAHANTGTDWMKVSTVSAKDDGTIWVSVNGNITAEDCNTNLVLIQAEAIGRQAMTSVTEAALLSGRNVRLWVTNRNGTCVLNEIQMGGL